MRLSRFFSLIIATLCLSACQQSFNTVFDHVEEAWDFVANVPTTSIAQYIKQDSTSVSANSCPQIHLTEELSTLSEFIPPSSREANHLISRVTLEQLESSCKIENHNIVVDLKLAFHSTLGKKAKTRNTDQAFFSYPFFIAITDIDGTTLAKEVFAASATYDRNVTTYTYYENIRQIIPISKSREAKNYQIYTGFHLSDEQLAYNRSMINQTEK